MGGSSWNVPGAAPSLFIVGGAPLLHPETQVFEGMLAGWLDQQLARNLSKGTIEDRLSAVQRFQRFTNEWPWTWRPADVEEYTAHLRSDGRERFHSTIRGYHGHVRLFLEYVADPRYEWTAVSERLFGTHPSQVFFGWNTAVHVAEYEGRPGRRSLTKQELQQFFDYADDQVAAARTSGRKGWLPAMRDATAMKATYAWGLRRREVIKLDLADLGHNPHAPEFGDLGVVYVRWGKASSGIPAMATRSRAWMQMVRQAPPSVLADALGISPKTAMRYAERAGTDYLAYATLRRPVGSDDS